MARKVYPTPTPKRVAWLRAVRAGDVQSLSYKSHTPLHCRALGWTKRVRNREVITPAGERILKVVEEIGL